MPFVAALRRPLPDAAGKDPSELQPPLPDRLITDRLAPNSSSDHASSATSLRHTPVAKAIDYMLSD